MTTAAPWQNRIVGYGEEPPDQLLANPKNWRIHPQAQQKALAGVLRDVGIVQNILVNRTTGHVVDGHLRVGLALSEGQPMVPVTYVELSEAEEAEILATIDPLAAMAATDKDQLEELLREVSTGEADVMAMLEALGVKEGVISPTFLPGSIEEQGRLDQRSKITCPECGAQFVPS